MDGLVWGWQPPLDLARSLEESVSELVSTCIARLVVVSNFLRKYSWL
jgi:hypothetical protein